VIVDVDGNDTVEVIATVDDLARRQVNGSDHDQGGVHVRCTATVTGPITSTSTQTDHDHDHVRPLEEL